MSDQDLIAAFIAKKGVTRVPEGFSQLELDKAERKRKADERRGAREYAEQLSEDRMMFAAECRDAARFGEGW